MIPHTEYPKIARERKAGRTLESIAKPYGVSRERIRQILSDRFPEITAEVAGRARKEISNRKRMKETQSCACGCYIIIPIWKKDKWGWKRAPRYVPGHQRRNDVPYERTSTIRAKTSDATKRSWAEGKHDNKIQKNTIKIRRKLWKILREHPGGLVVKEIIERTGIKKTTLLRWIRVQRYIKLDAHRGGGPGHPYIVKLAKESPVNLEDEMYSPHLNIDTGRKND